MTDRELLEQVLANQVRILDALQGAGLLPSPSVEDQREVTEAQRLALLFKENPAAYKSLMKARRKGMKRCGANLRH